MRFVRIFCIILCLLLTIQPFMAVSAAVSQQQGCHGVDANIPIAGTEKMLESAKAVVLYERVTGTLIYGYNMDELIYPASMVKMMTAIVALEKGNVDDIVTVTRNALDSVAIGSVSAGLVRGEQLRLGDLLYLMMVASANDAAAVIAEHIAGSQEAFTELMNDTARKLGCDGTNFTNAHGLHDKDNYTTARDILKIVEYGLENETFRQMFETDTYTVPATEFSEERKVATTNYMMSKETVKKYFDKRVTGGKTGATDQAGRCLTITAKVGDMELVGIVMGAKATYSEDGYAVTYFGSFEEMAALLNYAQETFEAKQLFYPGQIVTQYSVGGGSNIAVTPAEALSCVVPKTINTAELTWRYEQNIAGLKAPIPEGQRITDISVWYNGMCLAQTDLVAIHKVDQAPTHVVPDRNAEQKGQALGRLAIIIMLVIVGGVIVVFGGLILFRMAQTAWIKAKIRKRRRNRRRNRNARVG